MERDDIVICTDKDGVRLKGVVLHVFRNGRVFVDVGERSLYTRRHLSDARSFAAEDVARSSVSATAAA